MHRIIYGTLHLCTVLWYLRTHTANVCTTCARVSRCPVFSLFARYENNNDDLYPGGVVYTRGAPPLSGHGNVRQSMFSGFRASSIRFSVPAPRLGTRIGG